MKQTGHLHLERNARISRHHNDIASSWADLVYNRTWFSPERPAGATMQEMPGETWLIGGAGHEVNSWSA